jgi:hypothetical protein
MVQPTKGNSTKMTFTESAATSGQIPNLTKENGTTTKCMAQAPSNGAMVILFISEPLY